MKNGVNTLPFFHPALDAAQRAGLDFHAAAFADIRCQPDFQIGCQRAVDFVKLADE